MQQNTIETQIAVWNNFQKETTKQFITTVLNQLRQEIEICLRDFNFKQIDYNYFTDYTNQQQFFWVCLEQSWTSLLGNALIRTYGNDVSTLSEISLHSNIKFEGKPDLLVHLNHEGNLEKYLLECKMGEFTGFNYNNIEIENKVLIDYYNKVDVQAKKYQGIIAEHLLHNYQPTRIIIVFDWIRKDQAIKEAQSAFKETDLNKDPHTNFCALYTKDNSGIFVYGKVFEN